MITKHAMPMILLAAVLLAAPVLAGDEAGPEAARIWAAPGDVLGLDSQATMTLRVMDPYGSPSKLAEDWQLTDERTFQGFLTWHETDADGRHLTFRAGGDNDGESGAGGLFTMACGRPGDRSFRLRYQGFDHYYDRTSETIGETLVAPTATVGQPRLRWNAAKAEFRKLVRGIRVSGGYAYDKFDGRKSSLARGFMRGGDDAPAVYARSLRTHRAWLAGQAARGALALDWRADLLLEDGTNRHGDSAVPGYSDTPDNRTLSARLGAAYDLAPRTMLFGNFAYSDRSAEPSASLPGGDYALDGDVAVTSGALGAVAYPMPGLKLRLRGAYTSYDIDAWSRRGEDDYDILDKERSRRQVRLDLGYTGFAKTRLDLGYRYDFRDETESLTEAEDLGGVVVPVEDTDRERTTQEVVARARYKLSPKASLRLRADFRAEDVDQVTEGDDAFWLGDRSRNRTRLGGSLRTRPMRDLNLDLGYEMVRDVFERDDLDGVKTNWDTDRAFMTASWLVNEKLTLLAAASMGKEERTVEDLETQVDPDDLDGLLGVEYEGTTWRFAPGAVLHLRDGLDVEGHYEGVRQRDGVENDHDRWYLTTRYQLTETVLVTAAYRRLEFDEDRWDDYIADLYSLSLTTRF